jgi:DME family drug/metabolite transporter
LVLALVSPRCARGAFAALRQRPLAIIAAGVGLGAYQALYFIAVQDVGVSVATLISLGLAPIVLTTVEAIRLRERPTNATIVTVGAAVLGLALISLATGSDSGPRPAIGLLAAAATGLGYAASTALNRRLATTGDPLALTMSASVLGALALAPLAVIDGISVPIRAIPITGLAYLGAVATALAYWLFYRGLRSTKVEVVAVLTLLEALAAAVLAVLILHEPMPAAGIVGAALLLSSVAALYARVPPS